MMCPPLSVRRIERLQCGSVIYLASSTHSILDEQTKREIEYEVETLCVDLRIMTIVTDRLFTGKTSPAAPEYMLQAVQRYT
jgi:hypothetical protein